MILALDFDGVLHPYGCTVDRYFCRLQLLEAWLRRRPEVGVVISSSWRVAHPLDEMRSYFSGDLQARILGATPVLQRDPWEQYDGEPPPTRFERETEVLGWLHQSGEPWRPWAALDDQAWLFRPFSRHLVLCDGKVGLTSHELDQVDRVLGGRSAWTCVAVAVGVCIGKRLLAHRAIRHHLAAMLHWVEGGQHLVQRRFLRRLAHVHRALGDRNA